MPPAPATLSTITCCPSNCDMRGEMMRATTSIGPPAANGTTMVTGRPGQSCAAAGDAAAAASATAISILGMAPSRASVLAHPAGLDRTRPALDLGRHELDQVFGRPALRRRDGHADAPEAFAHRRRLHRIVRRL